MAFRLERVTRLRTHLRELRASELSVLNARLARLQTELAHTRAERERSLDDEARLARQGLLDEGRFRLGRTWERGLGDREVEIELAIARVRMEIESKRGEVLLARQEEQKLLRLEERHAAGEAAEVARAANAALDEFALQEQGREGRAKHGGIKLD